MQNLINYYQASAAQVSAHVTQREIEVLKLISFGFSTKEIATMLFISGHTVESHKKNLKTKLAVKNSVSLVRRAFDTGILKIMQFPMSA